MATSENTQKVTSARGWKKASIFEELPLPSGNVCRIRRVGLPELMASGAIPDSLTGIAQSHVDKAKGKKGKATADEALLGDILKDQKKLSDMMDVFDKATALCVIEPQVMYYKGPDTKDQHGATVSGKVLSEDERAEKAREAGLDPEDVVWTDEVDLDDKMFIFSFVSGGTRDLETFRKQLGESMGGLELS